MINVDQPHGTDISANIDKITGFAGHLPKTGGMKNWTVLTFVLGNRKFTQQAVRAGARPIGTRDEVHHGSTLRRYGSHGSRMPEQRREEMINKRELTENKLREGPSR